MTGRVKIYNESKGFGFIAGSDNQDYFFHISNVKCELINRGMEVSFVPKKGDRGMVAEAITTAPVQRKQSVIAIGNKRFKISNIKEYGISTETFYAYKQYKIIREHIFKPNETEFYRIFISKYTHDDDPLFERIDDVTVRYLYITNYQGDNDVFYDIRPELSNLNAYGDVINIDYYLAQLDANC